MILHLFFVSLAFYLCSATDPFVMACSAATLTSGKILIPFPKDPIKFIVCTGVGTFKIQTCSNGQVFSYDQQSCISSVITVTRPGGCTVPTWVNPSEKGLPLSAFIMNPCKPSGTNLCNTYKGYPLDIFKFIECNHLGQAVLKTCPPNWQWNQGYRQCQIPNMSTTGPITNLNYLCTRGTDVCPKKIGSVISSNEMYHVCLGDKHRFIQCDGYGHMYIKTCLNGLEWSQDANACGPGSGIVGK